MATDEELTRIARMADTIAMAALDLPPAERADFIKTAVDGVRDGFRRKCADDPRALRYSMEYADQIEERAGTVLKLLEASGGPTGHV